MSLGDNATTLIPANASHSARTQPGSPEATLFWILRLTCAAEFIGHGMVGVASNPQWLPYFAVVGIPASAAYRLMPAIGLLDLTVGVLLLFVPRRAVVLYAAAWGTWTALLRPLAGQGGWEFLEEVRNGLLPVSLLALRGFRTNLPGLITVHVTPQLDVASAGALAWLLRVTVAALLIGHGGMSGLTGQVSWATYLAVLGVSMATTQALALAALIGWLEIALGLAVLVRPTPRLLLFVVAWKVGTELLRPLAGEAIGQFVERAVSYGAPLALAVLLAGPARWCAEQRVKSSNAAGRSDVVGE